MTWFLASSAGIRYFNILTAQQVSHSDPAVFSAIAPLCTKGGQDVSSSNRLPGQNVHHYSSGLKALFKIYISQRTLSF